MAKLNAWTYVVFYCSAQYRGMMEVHVTYKIVDFGQLEKLIPVMKAKNTLLTDVVITNFILLSKPKWYRKIRVSE